MDQVERRFTQLVARALDGEWTEAEQEEFARLQREHPKLLAGCVEDVFTHNLLQWQYEDISDCMTLEQAASDREAALASTTRVRRLRAFQLAMQTAAAIGLIVTGFIAWRAFQPAPATERALADVVEQSGVQWDRDSTALRPDSSLVTGRLAASAGSFTMQFRSGPTVAVVAPVSLTIESTMLLHLTRGQATARVPQSSRGFTIRTPVAKVVDHGTEFGVIARDDGMTDVVVFEGSVDLEEMAGSQSPSRSLAIGEAARIDGLGSIGRIMEIGRDPSGQWWTGGPKAEEHLIASVRDNIATDVSDSFTCYHTTYGALKDDALAYADNPHHQWNGMTPDGLPEFLRGADYIKTFNDYRYRQDFQMTIEIARPTNLYVFADNRIPPPDWLKQGFEDTGVDIGLDEGPWLYQAPEEFRKLDVNTTDIGGGNSIDNTFSVWRRRCIEPGPVMLGNAGKWATEGKQGRAMYGIAATPLEVD